MAWCMVPTSMLTWSQNITSDFLPPVFTCIAIVIRLRGRMGIASWMHDLEQLCEAIMSTRTKISKKCFNTLLNLCQEKSQQFWRQVKVLCWVSQKPKEWHTQFDGTLYVEDNQLNKCRKRIYFVISNNQVLLVNIKIEMLLLNTVKAAGWWKYWNMCHIDWRRHAFCFSHFWPLD